MAVVLRKAVAELWEKGERQTWKEGERVLGVGWEAGGRRIAAKAVNMPTTPTVGPRREAYEQARRVHDRIGEDWVQIWAGGRNADVEHGRKEIEGLGERGLPTQTTLGGRVFGSWLQQVRMWQVDSHKPINKRGTWRHNRTKQWYELDHFTVSAGVKRACLQIRTFQGVADHRGKQMVMQLGREGKRKRRTERKQKFLAIEAKRKEGRVGRLNMEDFREN